ncbi:MAG: DUF1641 domain-containing protein [Haliangiales bacterium]
MSTSSVANSRDPASPAALQTTLRQIEDRLAGLERALAPLASLCDAAPAALATAGDIVDEWSRQTGDVDDRVGALAALAERLTRPQTLAMLGKTIDIMEQLPAVVAVAADVVDETAAAAMEEGLDPTHLAGDIRRLVVATLKLATSSELRELIESGSIQEALGAVAAAVESMAEARAEPPKPVGLFGAIRATREPYTQRALGFALRVMSAFGRRLGRDAEPKPYPELRD